MRELQEFAPVGPFPDHFLPRALPLTNLIRSEWPAPRLCQLPCSFRHRGCDDGPDWSISTAVSEFASANKQLPTGDRQNFKSPSWMFPTGYTPECRGLVSLGFTNEAALEVIMRIRATILIAAVVALPPHSGDKLFQPLDKTNRAEIRQRSPD